MRYLRPAFVLTVLFTLLLGLAFPAAMTGAATAIVPDLAGGSILTRDGHAVGSSLIGQNFTSDRYFHPRLSATSDPDPKDPSKTISVPYEASASAGANLAPTSKALIDRVRGDVHAAGGPGVPADAVLGSASGLDPDISPANAARQVARVAAARKLPPAQVQDLVTQHTQSGFFGEPHVNVLTLNMALDTTR